MMPKEDAAAFLGYSIRFHAGRPGTLCLPAVHNPCFALRVEYLTGGE